MTVSELIAKYNGKPCKVLPDTLSGKNTPQCFDLAIAFTDSLGVPHYPGNPSPFPYDNACQIFTDFSSWQAQYFDRIANTPDGMPQAGDIVVWSSIYNGGAGHVAIATGLNTDLNHFQAFEQNDPNPYCQLKDYSYTNTQGKDVVLGWLRCKLPQTTQTIPPGDDCPLKLKQITEERDRLNGVITGKDQAISICNSSLSSLTAEKNSLAVSLSSCQRDAQTYKEAYDALPGIKDQVTELERQKKVWIDKEIQLGKEYKALQTRYLNLKKPGLKFIQDAMIRLCEKMGVEL